MNDRRLTAPLDRWRRAPRRAGSGSQQSVLGGTAWIGGAAVISALTSLAIAVLLTRHFGPSQFGRYAALVAWATALAVLTEGGLATVLTQQVVRHPEAEGALVRVALRRRAKISLLGTTVAVLVLSLLGQGRPSVLALASMCVAYQFDLGLELPIAVWRARASYKRAAGWRIARRVLYLLATAGAVLLGADVQAVAVVAMVSAAPLALLANAVVLRSTAGSSRDEASLPLTTSGLYWTSGVLYWIYFQADQIMLTLLADPAELGFYAPAVSVLSISLAFHNVIADVLLPRMFEELSDHGGGVRSIRRRTMLQMPIFAAIAGLIWGAATLFAPEATRIVFGSRFAPTAGLLTILSGFIAMRFLSLPAILALAALNRMRTLVAVQASAAVLNIAGNALLIPRMGAKGSAFATLVSEALLLIGVWAFLPRNWTRSAAAIALPHVLMGACLVAGRLLAPGWMVLAVVLVGIYAVVELPLLSRQVRAVRSS